MEYRLPKDPAMLLSYVNTQLRDFYASLEEFCSVYAVSEEALRDQLAGLDYYYDVSVNQFK